MAADPGKEKQPGMRRVGDGGRWREEEKASERTIGGVSKGVKYTESGELLSESGGQSRSCHLISASDINAHFSFATSAPGFSSSLQRAKSRK